MGEVICMGVLVADLTAGPIVGYPKKGKMVMAERMQLGVGGCAANTAMVLSKLGVPTSLIAKVGNDDLGDYVIQSLTRSNVDVGGVRRDETVGTGCSMVLNSLDGDRSFITTLGANTTFGLNDIDWEKVKNSKLIHIGGALLMPDFDGKPAAQVFKTAKEFGVTTCLDTAWDESGHWLDTIADVLPYTDLFLPSLVEAEELTGKTNVKEIAHFFLDMGVKVMGIKMGKKGSCVYTKEKEINIPIYDLKTVDTNGAGDAYVGGFIAGWVKGLPLEETAYLANAVGALSTMAVGPVGGVKRLEEVLKIIHPEKETIFGY
ncbi:carbohydrate kinase family protein [Oscillospiraceae bacterium PP1C4]